MNSNIFIKGTHNENDAEFWFGKTLLLFHLSVRNTSFHKEMALVKYYTCVSPLDVVDKHLNCICLRWETEDGEDYSQTDCVTTNSINAGENYGLVNFQTVCGVVHVLRSNYAIAPFTSELPWTHHRFYVNRFLS